MAPFTRIRISPELLAEVKAHARAERPRECCGLIAGRIDGAEGHMLRRFPIRNDRASENEYLTNGRDLLDAMKAIRIEGLEPLAIYHSHPAGDPVPSRRDLEHNTWGETVVHLIVGLAGPDPEVRAWWLGEREYREAEMAAG